MITHPLFQLLDNHLVQPSSNTLTPDSIKVSNSMMNNYNGCIYNYIRRRAKFDTRAKDLAL